MKTVFDPIVWDQYLHWQAADKAIVKRINLLIKDVQRNGNDGIGKPEQLSQNLAGYWSRLINDEHRVVDDEVRIAACRYHYGNRRGANPTDPMPAFHHGALSAGQAGVKC